MKKLLLIFLITFAIFLVSGRGFHTRHHFFIPLAEAFLSGRLYVDKVKTELHEMIPDKEVKSGVYEELIDGQIGKYYVIYPPLPAILLMPFVAIWHEQTNQSLISILVAAISVVVSYLVFKIITKDENKALWMTGLYALGSMLWYHSIIGSAWYFSQVCALLFIWLAILFTLRKQNLYLIGLFVSLAYLSRFNLILSLPFFIYSLEDQLFKDKRIKLSNLSKILIPIVVIVSLSLLYNYARYGQLGHVGYKLLELRPYNINNEYSQGSYSFSYLSRNLLAIFWSFPKFTNYLPFIKLNTTSMALWIACPAIIIACFNKLKDKLSISSLIAIIFILPSILFHGGIGATQFGYRYALDFLPFVLILITIVIKEKFLLWHKLLISLSIAINLWGILASFWF